MSTEDFKNLRDIAQLAPIDRSKKLTQTSADERGSWFIHPEDLKRWAPERWFCQLVPGCPSYEVEKYSLEAMRLPLMFAKLFTNLSHRFSGLFYLYPGKEIFKMFKNLFIQPYPEDCQSETGQDIAEYAILIGLIALLVVISLTIIGTSISEIFNAIAVALRVGVWLG